MKTEWMMFERKGLCGEGPQQKCSDCFDCQQSCFVNQFTPKTVREISSNEGREWGSDCKHANTS